MQNLETIVEDERLFHRVTSLANTIWNEVVEDESNTRNHKMNTYLELMIC